MVSVVEEQLLPGDNERASASEKENRCCSRRDEKLDQLVAGEVGGEREGSRGDAEGNDGNEGKDDQFLLLHGHVQAEEAQYGRSTQKILQ